MFIGEYHHRLDDKGRIIIPAKLRAHLTDSFVMTRGLDGCVFIYRNDDWERLEQKLASLPLTRKEARAFVRFFYAAAQEMSLDKQGRVNISESLIQYAHLDKECIIVGVSNRIEIWNRQRWEEINKEMIDQFDNIAEAMIDFDF